MMDFLARVETMPIGTRTRFLAAYAHEHAAEDDFAALLAELAGHGGFAAELSLFLARVAGNREHVASLLAHEDPDIAAAATKAAAALGGLDAAVESAVLEGALQVRITAYKALRVWGREDLAARLLPRARNRFGEREAARLLPACGSAIVAEALPELAHLVTSWTTLARRHPHVFSEYAERSLTELPSAGRAQWWSRHRGGVESAAAADPARWLSLFDRFWVVDLSYMVGLLLPRLLTADPDAAWRFVLAPERTAVIGSVYQRRSVLRRLADRDTATIAAFLRACISVQHGQALLMPLVAPSRREAVLTASSAGRFDPLMRWPLAHLPKELRHKTIVKRLSHRTIADKRTVREDLRSHLPFEQVREELIAATARSSAEERASAYRRLIRCAGSDGPEAVTEMLGTLDRLGRDHDSVRVEALDALARVPARRWEEAHLAAVGDLIGTVLESPWRSRSTNQGLLRLAARLLLAGMSHGRPAFIEFGHAQLERIAVESGSRDVAGVLGDLPRPATMTLCRNLTPTMSDQAEVGRFKLPLVFAEALGRRTGDLPELCALLREATGSTDADTAGRAASALVSVDTDAAAELVEANPTMAAVPAVFDRLVRDRVDVLARLLAEPGRDVSALLRPLSRTVTRRWSTAVREAYLAPLASLARDRRRSARERAMAVRAMSRVAGLRTRDLEALLGDDPALTASVLIALDATRPFERAWELLTEHAAGPNAFIAGIGLARLARRMRPDFLSERLAPMLDARQAATRKQGVRLMLGYRVPGAEAAVEHMWGDRTLPEGVREAIVAGLVPWLDQPWARGIIEDSLRFGADVAAPMLASAPFALARRHHAVYADLLVEAVASGDERLMETALFQLRHWAHQSPRGREALVGLAADLDTTAHWPAAMAALRALAVENGSWEPLLEAVRRLRSGSRVEPNATADRDLPVRQRLAKLTGFLTEPVNHHRTTVASVPESLIELLPSDLGTRLLLATVPWDADANELRALTVRIGDPVEAFELARTLERRLSMERSADLLPFFERLASSGVPNACVLAAAAISTPGARAGWAPEWRELLRRLRDYPASEVSRLAYGVYTASE